MFGRMPKKSEELFLQATTPPIDDDEPIEKQEIIMHDVNIEEIIKAKLSVLALSLFSTDDGEPIKNQDPMMYCANIEEKTKTNCRF